MICSPSIRLWSRVWSKQLMAYVLVGALLGLIPAGLLIWLLKTLVNNFQNQQNQWNDERIQLLNRIQAKDLTAWQVMQAPTSHSPSTSEPYTPGMSDEEELKRMGLPHDLFSDYRGIGEVYAELEQDQVDLGLRPE